MTDYLQTWTDGVEGARQREGQRLVFTASSQYRGLRIGPDDRLFIAYLDRKRLHIMARVVVGEVLDQHEAIRRFGRGIWDAGWYVRTRQKASDPVAFDLRVPDSVVRQLRFERANGKITRLRPSPDGSLDGKALQAIRRLTMDSAALLDSIMEDESRPATTPVRVLPRRPTAVERRVIEERAMEVVGMHYRSAGWVVEDVHADRPYDLVCKGDGAVHHVEVKGLTGAAVNVELTASEVTHAQTCPETAILAVVEQIKLKRGEAPTARGGTLLRLDPWQLDDCDLSPTQFRYRLPKRQLGA